MLCVCVCVCARQQQHKFPHIRLQTKQHAESLLTGKECEYEELRFRRGSPLVIRESR